MDAHAGVQSFFGTMVRTFSSGSVQLLLGGEITFSQALAESTPVLKSEL
jgi:hypothetical protein